MSSVGSNPTEPTNAPVVQLVETAALKAAPCRFESGQAHHVPRLPMVRRADSKPAGQKRRELPALSADKVTSATSPLVRVFESPLGCHAPQQQVASGRVATSVCAVRFRGGAPTFSNVEEWTSC